MYPLDDTIVAIASAAGDAPRGIVRLSGPEVVACLSRLFTADGEEAFDLVQPRVYPGRLRLTLELPSPQEHAEAGRVDLPATLFLWPTARSYTRAPMAELHLIGSAPLLAATVRGVCQAGARLARAGEFTLRAFLAGRIDLAQAEAVLGVIDASDGQQFQTALAQLAGGFSRPLEQLRDDLLNLLADIEAGLDFVEEDIAFVSDEEIVRRLDDAVALVASSLAQLAARGRETSLATVVLVGRPNAGKSSLFNALTAGQALVSPTAGTTRDYLEAELRWPGGGCLLIDTAGIDDTPPPAAAAPATIESLAEEMTRAAMRQADVVVHCLAANEPHTSHQRSDAALVVHTKCDTAPSGSSLVGNAVRTSSATGEGVQQLREAIAEAVMNLESGGAVASTAARCAESLRRCHEALQRARAMLSERQVDGELLAEELRVALEELGLVTGAIYTDDLLDRVFSRFCIGK